jgi:hypothetical protein
MRNLVQACLSDEDRRATGNLLEGDTADPERHPIAIALRRQDDVDDARVTKNETLVRRGKQWFRYDAPDKRLFKQLQKTLTASVMPGDAEAARGCAKS